MNIRLFSLLFCLLMSVAQEVCANPITLRNKWGKEFVYDTVNPDLLGIPGGSIDDSDIYAFVIKGDEPGLQFINKCAWQTCMAQEISLKNWLENGVLPSGLSAQRVYVYKLRDGVYRLRKTISAASKHRRSVIIPAQLRARDYYGYNDDSILPKHRAINSVRESELLHQALHTLMVLVNKDRHDGRALQFMENEATAQSSDNGLNYN